MRFLLLLISTSLILPASDWPRFRGPNGEGFSNDKGLPSEIGPDKNVAWKTKTPKGNSSPIIVNGKLFITGHSGDERIVLCFDAATGEQLWSRSVTKLRNEPPNPLNGPTTPSPATDGKSVFVFIPEFGLLAYDFAGKELWRTPLGPFGVVQGVAVSPIYAEGNIILLIDAPQDAYLVAFDAATGKQVWKRERPTGFLGSYATPSLYKPADGPLQVIVAGAMELTGYQAKTGERIWWARGVSVGPAVLPLIAGDYVYTLEPVMSGGNSFKPMQTQFDKDKDNKITIATEVPDTTNGAIMRRLFTGIDKNNGNGDGILTEEEWDLAMNPKNPPGGLIRTKLNGKGDVTSTHIGWRYTKGLPYVLAPLIYQNVMYVIRNGGILVTIDPETGEQLREERFKDALGEYYAQPVAADGKIYFINKEGKATVLRAGKDWEKISSADFNEQVVATPAIANSRIYVRTNETLYCFAAPK
jgi:outer membrane protein assembly factor BamB